jgi:hypothetical protein
MKLASDLPIDRFAEPAQANNPLASWYAPGLSDELGDRLLMFDNSTAPSLELLRFRRTLTATPGFEAALRRRVERLSSFRHPSFVTVRAVANLGPGDGLALLSNYTPGKRLSEVLQNARGPAFATALIQQLAPALASLRQHDDGIGHGALAASRIVVTPEGRLMILEHVLGSALERLQVTAGSLRTEFGIAVPQNAARLDPDRRTDYFQLGLIAVSLLLGRRLSPDESPENVARILEQVARTAGRESPVLFRRLRVWLERALQLDGETFESSGEAADALDDLSDEGTAQTALQHRPQRAVPAQGDAGTASSEQADQRAAPASVRPEVPASASNPEGDADIVSPTPSPGPTGRPGLLLSKRPALQSEAQDAWPGSSLFVEIHPPRLRPNPASRELRLAPRELARMGVLEASSPPTRFATPSPGGFTAAPGRSADRAGAANSRPRKKGRMGSVQSLAAALALCVMGEGLVIATLLQRRSSGAAPAILVETLDPGADVLVDGRSAGVTPLQLNIGADTRSIRVVDSRPLAPGAVPAQPENRPAPPARAAVGTSAVVPAAPQRVGGIRLISPIDVEVFQGDKRLGSSATGIVSAAAGRHEFELVNRLLGYRARRIVDVKGGQVVSVGVSPPNGRLSINALPWAEVWIDGKSVGETPLGNLSVPLGEHEIVFRHPQLGEQRQTALVRQDVVTRVSANLQR